ncbi:hypothetical protein AB3X93_18835 [Paraburkholderia sp. BR14262]|uniref:hypothetical protein n=1 Tax=Paraburkholderia sp. BR14262 TaxID=3236999 RepID=UPI0034CF8148
MKTLGHERSKSDDERSGSRYEKRRGFTLRNRWRMGGERPRRDGERKRNERAERRDPPLPRQRPQQAAHVGGLRIALEREAQEAQRSLRDRFAGWRARRREPCAEGDDEEIEARARHHGT